MATQHDDEVASYEQELASYLQERIRPGLNRGAIPLLTRSIAKTSLIGSVPTTLPRTPKSRRSPATRRKTSTATKQTASRPRRRAG